MNYRDMAVAVCKIAGQDLIDRAEDLIPKVECVKNIDIWIRIPSLTDDPLCVPEIEVSTNLYPIKAIVSKIANLSEN